MRRAKEMMLCTRGNMAGAFRGRILAFFSLALMLACFPAPTQAAITLLGLGDSISEGVQSADSSIRTQPNIYLKLIAKKMRTAFPLPLIKSGLRGVVGDVAHRSRLIPSLESLNLAVSGADVGSLLRDRADAGLESEINSETDLVLFPRIGSQIEIAETYQPLYTLCWIGNNDVLGAALAFDHLDASQMTSIEQFTTDFTEITERLARRGGNVVFANIPSITRIGFLVDRKDLTKFLGSDYGLPEGSYTTIVAMFLLKLGFDDGSILQDPHYVLDAEEIQLMKERIQAFNEIIEETASSKGMPVVDMHAVFEDAATNPKVIANIPITPKFLGGIFSLDGVHPSNTTHALAANAFIDKINSSFGANIPLIARSELEKICLADPFVDKDNDGKVRGRFGAGVLETIAPFIGISGDRDETIVDSAPSAQEKLAQRDQFIRQYLALKGVKVRKAPRWSREDASRAFKEILGLSRLVK